MAATEARRNAAGSLAFNFILHRKLCEFCSLCKNENFICSLAYVSSLEYKVACILTVGFGLGLFVIDCSLSTAADSNHVTAAILHVYSYNNNLGIHFRWRLTLMAGFQGPGIHKCHGN